MKRSELKQIIKEEIAKVLNEDKEKLNESSLFQKMLRKVGWAGEPWTPQEIASQIKKLPNETLILWSKDSNGIPGTPLHFQQKLVKIEMDKRGLKEEIAKVLSENEGVKYKTLVDWYYIDDNNDEEYKGNKRGWVSIDKNANLDDFFPPEEMWGPGSSRYSRPEPKLIVGESGYIVTKDNGSMVFKPIGYDFEIPIGKDDLKHFQKLSKKMR